MKRSNSVFAEGRDLYRGGGDPHLVFLAAVNDMETQRVPVTRQIRVEDRFFFAWRETSEA